jgi:hypothetical protein
VLLRQYSRNIIRISIQSSKTAQLTSALLPIFLNTKSQNEQESPLTKTYEVPPFPNNDFALALYDKIYGKMKSKDKENEASSVPAQSANVAKVDNCCFYLLCRGRNKFATHTWENCHPNRHSAHYKQQANNRKSDSGYQTKSSSSTQSGKHHKKSNNKFKQKPNNN